MEMNFELRVLNCRFKEGQIMIAVINATDVSKYFPSTEII